MAGDRAGGHVVLPAWQGRVRFVDKNGKPGSSTAGAPSALVAFGEDCARAVADANLGMVVRGAERDVSGRVSLWEAR